MVQILNTFYRIWHPWCACWTGDFQVDGPEATGSRAENVKTGGERAAGMGMCFPCFVCWTAKEATPMLAGLLLAMNRDLNRKKYRINWVVSGFFDVQYACREFHSGEISWKPGGYRINWAVFQDAYRINWAIATA